MQKFKELCGKAFTARTGANLPFAKFLVELQHQSKYETQPLQEALMESFGDSNLFGGTRHRASNNLGFDVKVAVTSTSTSGNAIVTFPGPSDTIILTIVIRFLEITIALLETSVG